MARYAIFRGSQSASGFFTDTVIDTTKPEMVGGEHYKDKQGRLYYEAVCECYSEEDAELVCRALNALATQ